MNKAVTAVARRLQSQRSQGQNMNWGELVHEETDAKGVCYHLYITQDELEVRGNASASGDDTEDKNAEDEILNRLHSGDTWAWAATTCTAEYKGFSGRDHLGACSYDNTEGFIASGGYWEDMKTEARADLIRNARGAIISARKARQVVKELED